MQKFINLQETPFIDLRKKNQYSASYTLNAQLPSANLPKNQDEMQYKIHTNFTKYDQKPYQVPNSSDQEIIIEIIKAARNQFCLGYDLQTSTKFKQLSLKHVEMVVKYLKQDNPQAAFIAVRAQAYDNKYRIPLDKAKEIIKKTLHPLLLSQMVPTFLKSLDYRERSTGFEYLERILKGGLPEGFLFKGIYETKCGDGKIAYQMLKNAQILGYEPAAYKYLGQLFTGRNLSFSANLKVADKYFNKAKKAGAYIQPQLQVQIQEIQNQKKLQKLKADSIKSTEDTRSVQLANFLGNKINQFRFPKNQMFSTTTTSNMTSSQSVTFFNEPITFFVVFSPLMNFPARHFFVKNIHGHLQYVSIYNWDQIPIDKLKLLHEVGTKIVLNDYIRKTGARDQLPFYRVDDPHSVEFYQRTQKHTITDKQLRNYAKNLFQKNLLDKAMNIYEYMIMKGSEEMEIVYSNMGVIYERQNNISEAIKCYQNSLKVKKFNKSQLRLANIFIRNKQFDKVQKIIIEIQSPSERQQLLKQIQKLKEKENDVSNFSKTVKNKKKLKKQLYNNANSQISKISNPNPTCASNIREDRWNLLRFRQKYEEALGVKGLPQEKYLDFIQFVYNAIQNPTLSKQKVQKFFKMTSVAYTIKYGDAVYPCSASYFANITPTAMFLTKMTLINQVMTVFYMSKRQNYLENRIEDTCLMLQEKGQYKEAEQIYRYSGNYCAPFNVKVAEMLFLQGKYEQCEKYCITTISFMSQFQIVKFFKYIAGLAVWHLKSLIRQEKYEAASIKGEQYIKEFQKKNPKLTYEDHMFKNGITKFPQSMGKNRFPDFGDFEEVKDIFSANDLMQNIYRQIIRAFISSKEPTKARQYLPKVLLKKQTSNYSEILEQYYQTKILELLVIKLQNPQQAIKSIDALLKQINKDKKLQSKQLYNKFLLKEKLNLLLETGKTSEAIKQSQQIVKINSVNFFFVKNRLFSFIKKNSSKTFEILDKIKSSETLNCIWPELCQRSKDYLQKSIDQQQQKQTENILLSLQKLDLDLQPEDEEDKMQEEEVSKQAERFSFTWAEKQKASDFQDELYEEEYENEICRFKGKNGLTYIVIFDKDLRSSLEVAEERRFVSAADHLCHRENGSTGIKIFGTQIRLKIRGSGRLTGKIIDTPADPKIKFCHFIKRQNHDDYKRHGNN